MRSGRFGHQGCDWTCHCPPAPFVLPYVSTARLQLMTETYLRGRRRHAGLVETDNLGLAFASQCL